MLPGYIEWYKFVVFLHATLRITCYSAFSIYRAIVSINNSERDDVIKWKHFPRHWPFVREPPVTKPLPEPLLTYQQWDPMKIIWAQVHTRYLNHKLLRLAWKVWITKLRSNIPVDLSDPEVGQTKSMSRMLTSWLLASPGHQQSWYWLWVLFWSWQVGFMMTPSRENIFLATGPLWGESIGSLKGQWHGASMFFFDLYPNKRLSKILHAHDLRRHRVFMTSL